MISQNVISSKSKLGGAKYLMQKDEKEKEQTNRKRIGFK